MITDMAADELPLSDYARELSISNKKRYLEKLSGIQDPYLIPPSELMKGVFPPAVTNTWTAGRGNKSICTKFRRHQENNPQVLT